MYDYHVSGDLNGCTSFGSELGWKGICYAVPHDNFDNFSAKKKEIDVARGVIIRADTMNMMRKLADGFRDKAEIVIAAGGDVELNRYIFNMKGVDVVSGIASTPNLDYVMCKLAEKNSMAIEFSFADLLHSYSKTRSEILAFMTKNAALVRKYHAPFVITSGALSKWDMRSPHDLTVFGRILGFQDPEIKRSMSGWIIENNRKRASGKAPARGIEVL